jgi:hypothetical protein
VDDILEMESMDIRDSSKRERKEKRRLKEEKMRQRNNKKNKKIKSSTMVQTDTDSGKCTFDVQFEMRYGYRIWFAAGLWTRIDSMQIRIQHISSIRIHKSLNLEASADPDTRKILSFRNQNLK